jgi:hypothetical protein
MKRMTVMLAAVLACVGWASSAGAERENSLRDGAWALQFSINGGDFFSLSSFAGGVSVKRHFTPKSAVRAGVSFDAEGSTYGAQESDSRGVSLSILYQRYVNPTADANLYWGVGPSGRFDDDVQETHRDSLTTVNESELWSAGLSGVVGVEWFAARVISLHAEYEAAARYTWVGESTEYNRLGESPVRSTRESEGWSIGAGSTVRFGLSVYF